jgi:polyisoprenoid-binding protein YceI
MKLSVKLAWLGLAALSLAGCSAALSPLAGEAAPPPSYGRQPNRITVAIEPPQVRVEARVKAVTNHSLKFGKTRGRWSAPRGRLDQSLIELEFEMGAVTSEPQKLADLAMSDKFLDARAYPKGYLYSRRLRPRRGTPSTRYDLFFDMVLKDRLHHLVAPAELRRVGCTIHFATTFSVERRAFQIQSTSRYDSMVGEHVEVRIEVAVPARPFGVPCVEQAPPS